MPAPVRLPDELVMGDVALRRWTLDHLDDLHQAIIGSVDHLRPWMPWIASEPQSLEQRGHLIEQWEADWRRGGDVVLGIFLDGEVAGGCGLHRRGGPRTLDIGYWLRPSHQGAGLATTAASLLTDAAFSVPGIEAVEIHHDKANHRSSRVPRRLGFSFAGEQDDHVTAPGEVGIDCTWRTEASTWAARDGDRRD